MSNINPIVTNTEKQERTFQWDGDNVKVTEEIKQHITYDPRSFVTLAREQEKHHKGLKWQLEDEYKETLQMAIELMTKVKDMIEANIDVDKLLEFGENEKANEVKQNIYLLHKMLRDNVFDYEHQLENKDKVQENYEKSKKIFDEMEDYSKEIKAKWAKDYKDKMAEARKSKK